MSTASRLPAPTRSSRCGCWILGESRWHNPPMPRQPAADHRDLCSEERLAGVAFRHELLLYRGEEGFLAGTVPFIEQARSCGEPVLVAARSARIELLKDALGAQEEGVEFTDVTALAGNPARIIPAWRRFLD